MERDPETVSMVLARVGMGDEEAHRQLFEIAYDELRVLAGRVLARERPGGPQRTTLVHEAYLKLTRGGKVPADNRRHFFGAAGRAMRQILVDAARKQRPHSQSWIDHAVEEKSSRVDLVALDEALEKLVDIDERKVAIVNLRFFLELTIEETAEVIGLDPRTIKREWRMTKAWLKRELSLDDTRS